MSWKKLQAESKVHVHKTSKKELGDLRAVILRDLEDAEIQELSDGRRFAPPTMPPCRRQKCPSPVPGTGRLPRPAITV
jgi:hypothetical protein